MATAAAGDGHPEAAITGDGQDRPSTRLMPCMPAAPSMRRIPTSGRPAADLDALNWPDPVAFAWGGRCYQGRRSMG